MEWMGKIKKNKPAKAHHREKPPIGDQALFSDKRTE